MNIYSFIVPGLFCLISTSYCLLRRHCQVLEKKYTRFVDLKFENCNKFNYLDFSTAVNCDGVEDLRVALKEVPSETDWLCLSNYKQSTMEAESFARFSNLKALYLQFQHLTRSFGTVEITSGSFRGLSQLSTLWIKSESLRFHKGAFYGLDSLQELKISKLPVSTFNLSVFSHLHRLDHLILKRNNITYLSEVTTQLSVFKNLSKLSIIGNNIDGLRKDDCLKSLGAYRRSITFKISYLDLSGTPLRNIEKHSLCNFPNLEMFQAKRSNTSNEKLLESGILTSKTVSLPKNEFSDFEICKFVARFKVEKLLINSNNLHSINTLEGSCKGLKKLDVSTNNLVKVEAHQTEKLKDLLELDLSLNQISSLNICVNDSVQMSLIHLNASFNYLLRLERRQFACLKNLKTLSLENNRINQIEEFTFYGLGQLLILNLQQNNLFCIDKIMSNLSSLTQLDLYDNKINTFTQNNLDDLWRVQNLGLTFDSLAYAFLGNFANSSVRHLSVKAQTLEMLPNAQTLERLEIDAAYINSCVMLAHVKELHLRNTVRFTCPQKPMSPLRNFTSLKKLYYKGNKHHSSHFFLNNTLKLIPSLNFLYLQNTDKGIKKGMIKVHGMFQGLSRLKVLHLKNSGIDRLDSKDLFNDLREIEFLIVEKQNMQAVTKTAFESLDNLKYIYFLKTTFPCSCKLSGLLSWLEFDTSLSIINFHNQECLINQNALNLVSFLRNNCKTNLELILFVASYVFTLLFLCMSLFYESIWWNIRYVVFTVECWLNHKKAQMIYQYDVFVSYNKHNEPWVAEQLLPKLELNGPPFFKVCIHNRDFEIGKAIVDNIMDSIYNSRWTVCVITHSYLHSNWCSLEMRMAMYRLLAESKDSLVLIFLDKLSREELQHYHRLTKLLDKKTYLQWPDDDKGQQLFWARLRKVIAKTGRKVK
ncbi:toll-like receptor 12 [Gastrophryne carolinensis]